jgi:hypothetical protein
LILVDGETPWEEPWLAAHAARDSWYESWIPHGWGNMISERSAACSPRPAKDVELRNLTVCVISAGASVSIAAKGKRYIYHSFQ